MGKKGGETGKRREEKTKQTTREDAMVFGDNVRARWAARALPRTPTQRRREKEDREDREDREEKKTSDETSHPHTPTAIPQPTTQHNKTTHTTQHIKS